MCKFEYESILASFIDDFIRMIEALGVNNLRTKWILLEFDRFYCQHDIKEPVITKKQSWNGIRQEPSTIPERYMPNTASSPNSPATCQETDMTAIILNCQEA